jgi:predicted AlkP superfamily pyrophosphatase or phosphodiesterase
MKKIIVLFIDAFSHSYVNKKDTPFLSKQEVCTLAPVFGFKQLAAAFTGLTPLSTGIFTEYYYDPEHSPYKWTKIFPSSFLSMIDSLSRLPISVFSRWVFYRANLTSKLVPLETSRFFAVNRNPFPVPSPIISLLQKKRLSYRFVFFPEVKSNEEAFDLLETLSTSNQIPDFLFVHFPELDPLTHACGTKSSRTRNLVRKIDLMISNAVQMIGKDSYLIAFSDHGMLDVKGHIDITAKINTLDCSRNDFVVFLDSIMARFWVFNESTFEKITRLLNEETAGKIFLPDKPQTIDKFGHIMFLCSPGYVISPNYYDSRLQAAMHGYASPPQISPLNGIFLTKNLPLKLPNKRLLMTDIASILTQTINCL